MKRFCRTIRRREKADGRNVSPDVFGKRQSFSARSAPQRLSIRPQNEGAWEDHLWVQQEIEKRALHLWVAGGGHGNDALNDWLAAERDVLAEYVSDRSHSQSARFAPGEASSMSAAPSQWRGFRLFPSRFAAAVGD